MSPPVALLVYEADAPSGAVYYPFATFSPEWQALRWALDKDVPARFIDLPQSLRRRDDRPEEDAEDGEPAQATEAPAPEAPAEPPPPDPRAARSARCARARGRVLRWRGVVEPAHRRTPRRGRSGRALRRDPRRDGVGARGAREQAARHGGARARSAHAQGDSRCPQGGLRAHRGRLRRVARAGADGRRPQALTRRSRTTSSSSGCRNARPRRPGSHGPTIVSASTRATEPASPAPGGTTICGCTAGSCPRAG